MAARDGWCSASISEGHPGLHATAAFQTKHQRLDVRSFRLPGRLVEKTDGTEWLGRLGRFQDSLRSPWAARDADLRQAGGGRLADIDANNQHTRLQVCSSRVTLGRWQIEKTECLRKTDKGQADSQADSAGRMTGRRSNCGAIGCACSMCRRSRYHGVLRAVARFAACRLYTATGRGIGRFPTLAPLWNRDFPAAMGKM